MKLVLEVNKKFAPSAKDLGVIAGGIAMITPAVGEKDYWMFRVKVSKKQAVIGFPKFGTVGIGFMVEDADWNTNLPYSCPVSMLFNHIKKNKGSKVIKDADCKEAIKMIQKAATEHKKASTVEETFKRR
jgi:hypothetical protein